MDNSWLLTEDSSNDYESESDEGEKQMELESRLYSVVHHNDLSQPLPDSLAEQFSVECSDSGEVVISLKKPVDDLLVNANLGGIDINEGVTNLDDDVMLVNESTPARNNQQNRTEFSFAETPLRRKRFRYSDINIDEVNKFNGSTNNSLEEDNRAKINYFKPIELEGRNETRFREIKLPAETTLKESDWKSDSNAQFISFNKLHHAKFDCGIVKVMTNMLKTENPNVGKRRLKEYAILLYILNTNSQQANNGTTNNNLVKADQHNSQHTPNMIQFKNTQLHQTGRSSDSQATREVKVNKLNNAIELNGPITNRIISNSTEKIPVIEIEDDESDNILIDTPKNNRKGGRKKNDGQQPNSGGSISLNISSFKPIVNLSSDDDDSKSLVHNTPISYKASRKNLPQKWTKNMIKFYTTPSKRKLNQSIEQMYSKLNEQSGPEDWVLDYQDRIGIYESSNIWRDKCRKCGHRGHNPQKCDFKVKCSLCAGPGHLSHNCPIVPCLMCGKLGQRLLMDQECRNCYMLRMRNEACHICLSHEHHPAVCPDTWRSFHATIDGDKKVPQQRQENPRKWCCNCARRGHFSHACPLPVFNKQPSPFVVNYSIGSCQDGSVDITVPSECYEIINNEQADSFLQNLSNQTGAFLKFAVNQRESTINVSGTFEQCNFVKREVEQYINTKKRTIQQPTFKNKRRKL